MDDNQIKLAHVSLDKSCDAMKGDIPDLADRILFDTVQRAMLHAIIEMGVRHRIDNSHVEASISKAIAGIVHAYVKSTTDGSNMNRACDTASDIVMRSLFNTISLVATQFEGAASDETVH